MSRSAKASRGRVPQSFEELVEHYDHYIDVMINRISRRAVRADDAADLKQAVYARLLETNYLARYDPAKGGFPNFLYFVIRSVVVNAFDRNTRNPLTRAKRLVPAAQTLPHRRRASADERVDPRADTSLDGTITTAEVIARLQRSAAKLREGSAVVAVLDLLLQGWTVREIGRKTKTPLLRVEAYQAQLATLLRTQLGVPA